MSIKCLSRISRLSLLVVFIAPALTSVAVAGEEESTKTPVRPNVLLICVDDLKPLLDCYGAPHIKTPNIDRLAERGVMFRNAYCNQAVCAPSRNALMTGLRPQTIGIYDLHTNFREAVPNAVTVAQQFKNHGYRTETMGKIFHISHKNHDDPASWSVAPWRPRTVRYVLEKNTKQALAKKNKEAGIKTPKGQQRRGAATECADVPDNTYDDGLVADEAVKRIESAKANSTEPWFIGVGFYKPHLPFVAPKKYWDLYDPDALPQPKLKGPPAGAPKFSGTNWGELRAYGDMPTTGPLDEATTRRLIHGYHAAVSYTDAQIGRVLDALEANGFAENTIVVLWGDHGWHLGDHGYWCKHTNYEQAVRIPVIVAAPGVAKRGGASDSLVETVDIYPTLCKLAGLPTPEGLDGADFVAALRDPNAETKEAIFHAYPRGRLMGRAVRTKRYRLVEWKPIGAPAEDAAIELYDYIADPAETKNLAAEKPEVVARLRAILARQPEAVPQIKKGK